MDASALTVLLLNQDVLQAEVSMIHVLRMQVVQATKYLIRDHFRLHLGERLVCLLINVLEVIVHVALVHQLGNHVEVAVVVEQLVKLLHVLVLDVFEENYLFQEHLLRVIGLEHTTEWHLLDAAFVTQFFVGCGNDYFFGVFVSFNNTVEGILVLYEFYSLDVFDNLGE